MSACVPFLHERSGQAIAIALVVFLLLGALAAGFYQIMMATQHSSGIFFEEHLLRRVVEAGLNEAFQKVRLAAGQSTAESRTLMKWFAGKPTDEFSLPLPLTGRWGSELVRRGLSLRLTCNLAQRDIRECDSKGNRYYPGEKLGTLAITVTGSLLRPDGTAQRSCTFIRHHDLKVAAIVTPAPADGRKGYANFFPLDYSLLVRNGLDEFIRTSGQSVNPPQQRLLIEQPAEGASRLGKIFFGGTGRDKDPKFSESANAVFVNVPPDGKAIIPALPPTEIRRIDRDTCIQLIPQLGKAREFLTGLEGVFTMTATPIPPVMGEPANEMEHTQQAILNGVAARAIGPERNIFPGLELIGPWQTPLPPDIVAQCLEGSLRQRFLHAVTFHLDLSKIGQVDPAIAEQLKDWSKRIPCLLPDANEVSSNLPEEYLAFAAGVRKLSPNNDPPLFSAFRSDFPLMGGMSGMEPPSGNPFPDPVFFSFTGARIPESRTGWQDGFSPYRHFNLLTHRFETLEELETYGLLDRKKGELRLNGAVTIMQKTPVVLERLTIRGQGALTASGFRIRGGLKKATPEDLAILISLDGPIWVDTDEPVEAALMAVNHGQSGRIIPSRPLSVFGAVCVDELDAWRWPSGSPHRIRYDPAFSVTSPVFQPFLSPWISYQKQVFDT